MAYLCRDLLMLSNNQMGILFQSTQNLPQFSMVEVSKFPYSLLLYSSLVFPSNVSELSTLMCTSFLWGSARTPPDFRNSSVRCWRAEGLGRASQVQLCPVSQSRLLLGTECLCISCQVIRIFQRFCFIAFYINYVVELKPVCLYMMLYLIIVLIALVIYT